MTFGMTTFFDMDSVEAGNSGVWHMGGGKGQDSSWSIGYVISSSLYKYLG